jgi:hypothetical protein
MYKIHSIKNAELDAEVVRPLKNCKNNAKSAMMELLLFVLKVEKIYSSLTFLLMIFV